VTRLWRLLIEDVGFEKAVLFVCYVSIVVSCVMALVAQIAWSLAKSWRPRRELQDVAAQRRRELDAVFNLTERGR
jgi:hypothetical protein